MDDSRQQQHHRNSYCARFKRIHSHLISCGFARIIFEMNYDLVASFVCFPLIFLSGGLFAEKKKTKRKRDRENKRLFAAAGVVVTLEIELLFLAFHISQLNSNSTEF